MTLALSVATAAACAHQGGRSGGPLSESARRFAAEAAAVRTITYEEDYVDARLVFQALPLNAPA